MGDINGGAIATITKCKNKIKSDILRLSHHRSTVKYANYNEFLRTVHPRVAFSSSNPCHATWRHPSCYIAAWFSMVTDPESFTKRSILDPSDPHDGDQMGLVLNVL